MKRLLIVANGLEGGGAEKVLITLINNLDAREYDITLYSTIACDIRQIPLKRPVHYHYFFDTTQPNDNVGQRFLKKLKNKVKLLCFDHLSPRRFYSLFVRGRYDIEFAAIEGYATKIISGSGNSASRKISWVHTDLLNNHWTQIVYKNKQQETDTYRQFDQIVCVSASVKENFTRLFGITDSLSVIYNPIDVKEIQTKAEEPVQETSSPDVFKIVTVGRLVEQKGFDRLLSVHKRLLAENFHHELWILGEGPLRGNMETYIKEHNLTDSVRLLGFQNNPYAYMAKCDLFVCSSRAEGFSLVIAEAMIIGLPIVSTNCSGPNELVNFGEYGVLTPNSEEGIYQGIKPLMENKIIYVHYQEKAMERSAFFNLKKTMEQFTSIF